MSLKRISLRDFVIVSSLELDFSNGFTVLCGETGAGKSILIDALQMVLGGRSDAGVVRESCAKAEICAEFDTPAHLQPWLDDNGFDFESELLLKRTIDAQGKSRAWINASTATATQLRELGDRLIDIHGQHAWQSLTRSDSVRGLLDAYGKIDSQSLLPLWHAWRQAQKNLEDARQAQNTIAQERDRLMWQIGELDKLAPLPHEWDELNANHTRLTHAQSLIDAAQHVINAMQADKTGVQDQLSQAQHLLNDQSNIESEFLNLSQIVSSALAQCEDVTHSLQAWLRRTDLDPHRLKEIDERMSLWMSLSRRFKRPPAELAEMLQHWKTQLAQLDAATDIEALEKKSTVAEQAFTQQALSISKARKKSAPLLAKAITQAMQGLGMQGGVFDVQLQTLPQASAFGLEDIVFLVAGHAGTTPKPVGKVASGGELSRIALAIAVTTSQLGEAQTLIFDEVDSGVGGAVAQTVGKLMKQLGRDRQVLAVTHLPQVAACADHHLVVSKHSDPKGTHSTVEPVTGEARVSEIARMLGGAQLSATTHAHAREMLETQISPSPHKKGARA